MVGHRALARNHDFRLLWIGQTISELGSRMSLFVFPLLAWQLTRSTLAAALVEAVFLLGEAATLLPAGVLADRLDRGRLMRLASGSGVLLYGSLAVAGFLGQLTVPHLVGVAVLTGVATGIHSPAETSAVRSVVPDEDLGTALSQLQARQHVAGLVGAPVGGALLAVARWVPFAGDALSYAVAWLLLGRVRADLSPVAYDGPRSSARDEIREGLAFTLRRSFFRTMLIWSAMANLTVNGLFFVAILRLIEGGFHPAEIGLVETVAGVAGLLGAIAAPRIIDRFATGRLTVLIAWSFVPLVAPMVLWNRPAVVAGCLAVGMLLNPASNAGIGAYRVAMTPDRLQGRVGSAMRFLATFTLPLAPVIGGGLMAALGGPAAIAAMGALTAVAALVVTLSRSVRTVPRPVVWQAELAATRPAEPTTAEAAAR
ncbi:MAG TPA: MFS transporter [Nocardioidaceae bacterium]|nr:MFS transporter [Nocardioidaceae bacterium]